MSTETDAKAAMERWEALGKAGATAAPMQPQIVSRPGLPRWRANPHYADMGLSPDSMALLDASETVEAQIAERIRRTVTPIMAAHEQANVVLAERDAEMRRIARLSIEQLRDELQFALDRVAAADSLYQAADCATSRASDAVAHAVAVAARYDDIDARVASVRADAARQGIAFTIPPDLTEARIEQRRAMDDLRDARNAYATLACELETARLAVEEARNQRDHAAMNVITRQCDGLAAEIEITTQALYQQRQRLLSITAVQLAIAGAYTPLSVSDRVRGALRRTDERPPVSEAIKASTADLFARLRHDADAEMRPDPTHEEPRLG
jgi:hypothetical protein